MDSERHPQYSLSSEAGDRFPQWSLQETRDFLMIRAELDPSFMDTKRNKPLWEMIAARMRDKGYSRSPDQCKCKWKNLVTRYKGCEAMEAEGIRQQQFTFYNELQAIFGGRMQRMVWNEAESSGAVTATATTPRSKPTPSSASSSDGKGGRRKKGKMKATAPSPAAGCGSSSSSSSLWIREMMEDFMRQQMEMEVEWMKAYEAREAERRAREAEWRRRMEALENERVAMVTKWRENEAQRRVREEAMAEKRDALIQALLHKLRSHDNM